MTVQAEQVLRAEAEGTGTLRRTIRRLLLALVSILAFYAFAYAILGAKTLQLQVELSRRQLLNYRLSSAMLRSRIEFLFQRQTDFAGEVRVNVLESSVMNADLSELPLEMGPARQAGIAMTNLVRVMNFKQPLHIGDDRGTLLLLQYAFFLERKKRYPEAVTRYRQVLPRINSDADRAFVHLHLGYCLTLLGAAEEARAELRRARGLDESGHFADAAAVLLAILDEQRARAERIRSKPSARGRAIAYFEAGQFRRALAESEQVRSPGPALRLMIARSYEETGQVRRAAEAYRGLAEAEAGPTRRQAVRRLLLLGEFLSPDPEVTRFARRQAVRTGEAALVRKIRAEKSAMRRPVLLRRLSGAKAQRVDRDIEVALAAEVRKLFPGRQPFAPEPPEGTAVGPDRPKGEPRPSSRRAPVVAIRPDGTTKRPVARPQPVARPKQEAVPPAKKQEPTRGSRPVVVTAPSAVEVIRRATKTIIRFNDGRQLPAERAELRGGELVLEIAGARVSLPSAVVREIAVTEHAEGALLTVSFPEEPTLRVRWIRRVGPGQYRVLVLDGREQEFKGEPEVLRFP